MGIRSYTGSVSEKRVLAEQLTFRGLLDGIC